MFNIFEKPTESLLDTIAQGIAIEYLLQLMAMALNIKGL